MGDVGTLGTQLSWRCSWSWNDHRCFLKWAIAVRAAVGLVDQSFKRFRCSILELFRWF